MGQGYGWRERRRREQFLSVVVGCRLLLVAAFVWFLVLGVLGRRIPSRFPFWSGVRIVFEGLIVYLEIGRFVILASSRRFYVLTCISSSVEQTKASRGTLSCRKTWQLSSLFNSPLLTSRKSFNFSPSLFRRHFVEKEVICLYFQKESPCCLLVADRRSRPLNASNSLVRASAKTLKRPTPIAGGAQRAAVLRRACRRGA